MRGNFIKFSLSDFVNNLLNDEVTGNDAIEAITNRFMETNHRSTLAVTRHLKAG